MLKINHKLQDGCGSYDPLPSFPVIDLPWIICTSLENSVQKLRQCREDILYKQKKKISNFSYHKAE